MATQFEIDCALMAGRAYQMTRDQKNWFSVPDGWSEFFHVPNPANSISNGFEAVSFTNGNEIVISYAGTYITSLDDWQANGGLAAGIGSTQLVAAADYYLKIKAANPGATITFTGHSLGGGLAALMGVFFNEKAVTFDQTPFANSANTVVKDYLAFNLRARGYTDQQLADLLDPGFNTTSRVGNVSGIRVTGEFTSPLFPVNLFSAIGAEASLPHGTPDLLLAFDLHSQALLTAFMKNDGFRQVTFKLPDLLWLIFDSDLYDRNTRSNSENFLERLIRHEFGNAPGVAAPDKMLTRFTLDMQKIAQDGGLTLTDNNISKTLIAFAMQMYYEKTTAADKQLFTDVAGGIRFDRSDVASSLIAAKGYQYFRDYLEILPSAEREIIDQQLPALLDWFIQAGGGAMSVGAAGRAAFMLGGAGGDSLTGSDQADVLIGNGGADTLTGGNGDDSLLGGAGGDTLNGGDGYDTYIIEGNDTIRDSDGKGRIRDKSGNFITGFIQKRQDGSYMFLADPNISVTKDANLTLTLVDGSRTIANDSNYQHLFGRSAA